MQRVAHRLSGLSGSSQSTHFRRLRWRIPLLLAALLMAGAAQAGADNCDGVLTDGQKEQRKFCDTHMGCSLVTSIMDSCISVKSFLKALSPDGKGPSNVNDGMVSEALEEIGVPKPGIASCTLSFDRSQCRQFLGMEQAPIPTAPVKYTPTPIQEIANEARELRSQYERAKLPGDEYRYATNGLAACAQAVLHDSRYEQVCGDAQRKVDECVAYREAWYSRRKTFMESASKTNLADASQTIAKLEMPYCPTTLSEVDPVTPTQAIARRKAELDAPPRVAVVPQAQEIDLNGRWVDNGSGEQWDLSVLASKLTLHNEPDTFEYERISPGVYRATNGSNCLLTVKLSDLIEWNCKSAFTLIPLGEVLKKKLGRIDLTGTWAQDGDTHKIVTDFKMRETGLTFDNRKYSATGFVSNYVQTSPTTYANLNCKLIAPSTNLITATCIDANFRFMRLTPQQIAEANRSQPPPAATQPAPSVSMSGYWRCDQGNRVQLVDRGNGFAVTGTGASGEFFYRKVNQTTYEHTADNGSKNNFVLIDKNTVRPTNSDGWTDICHRE